ncbi:peptidoglycan-binding protein [Pedobacter immunditicola]|uniref:peptidoglycan-binding protein n=1 Tax=Pedobacter immunditicola TaxID=3133440 RepID=UPI0030A9AEF8
MPLYLLIALVSILTLNVSIQAQTSADNRMVKFENNKLVYNQDKEFNRIPDFSFAGYKNSNVDVPAIKNVIRTISPIPGDNTDHINKAIQASKNVPKDDHGQRGVLLLKKGKYDVYGIINVDVDGLVIRGEGSGNNPDEATVIYGRGNSPAQRNIMVVGSGTKKWQKATLQTDIVTDFVQVSSNSFEIKDAKPYQIGDLIVIEHPCSEDWLKAVDYGGTADDTIGKWTVGFRPIVFKRTITKIKGNQVTIDVPFYNHLNRKLSQSVIYKVKDDVKSNIGIENLRIEILDWKERDNDEDHAKSALQMAGVKDSWIKDVSAANFSMSGFSFVNAERVSVLNCIAEDPVSLIKGGRRYNFSVDDYCGQILFKDCIAKKGRHNYVSNGTTTVAGIVYLNCLSVDPYATTEGHRQWSMAMLFDNFKDIGTMPKNKLVLGIYNRGSYGTGHGWANAHSVLWNCDVRREDGQHGIMTCQKPPTAQNYVIGGYGTVNKNTPFPQYPYGYVDGVNQPMAGLLPESLFLQQLKERLAQH